MQSSAPSSSVLFSERLLASIERFVPLERDLPSFGEWTAGTLNFKPHRWQEEVLFPLIERFLKDKGLRIAVHAPPQYGKTVYVSQRMPAYGLGVNPDARWALACYNETRAEAFAEVVRGLMQHPDYAQTFGPEAAIPPTAARGEFWTVKRRRAQDAQPSFKAMGLNSGFVGRGVDYLVIDDPYKSDEEAESEAISERVWRFWEATAKPRLSSESNVMVMFHRYNERDLAARLIQEGGWEIVRLPAIADGGMDDPTGREPGELLSPMRTKEWLDAFKAQSPRIFAAQFQGTPQPESGGMFKKEWFRRYEVSDEFFRLHRPGGERLVRAEDCWTFVTADLAATVNDKADWTVIGVWAVTPQKDLLLREIIRVQEEGPEVRHLIAQAVHRWGARFVAADRQGLGAPIVQEMRRAGLAVRGIASVRDPRSRALGWAVRYEGGQVYHKDGLEGLAVWEAEHLAYDRGQHDDCVFSGWLAGEVVQHRQGILQEFNPIIHVAPETLEAPSQDRPLHCGWAFWPQPAFVAGQMMKEQYRVYGAWIAPPGTGILEFGQTILDRLHRWLGNLGYWQLVHASREGNVGGSAGNHGIPDAARILLAGQQTVSNYDTNGLPIYTKREGLGIALVPVSNDAHLRDELLRVRLRRLTDAGPALLVCPTAGPVLDALSGGYAFRMTPNGIMGTEAEPNEGYAVVEALTCALSALYVPGVRTPNQVSTGSWGERKGIGAR